MRHSVTFDKVVQGLCADDLCLAHFHGSLTRGREGGNRTLHSVLSLTLWCTVRKEKESLAVAGVRLDQISAVLTGLLFEFVYVFGTYFRV